MKKLAKLMTIFLVITLMVPFVGVPSAVAQERGTVVFHENFDSPVVPDGTPIIGFEEDGNGNLVPITQTFNGWKMYDSRTGSNTTLQQAEFTVETQPGTTNRVGSLVRPSNVDIVTTMGIYMMEKEFESPVAGVIDISFQANPVNMAARYMPVTFHTSAGASALSTQVNFNQSKVRVGDPYLGPFGDAAIDKEAKRDHFYNFTFRIDTVGKKFYLFEGVELIGTTDIVNAISDINAIRIGTHRNDGKQQGAQILLDEIKVVSYSDQEVCAEVVEDLETHMGDAASGKLTLPLEYYGANISWTSSNTEVISNIGEVTIPEGSGTVSVTLTANITKGSASAVGTYTFDIEAIDPMKETIHFEEYFNDESIVATQPMDGYNGWSELRSTHMPDPIDAPDMNVYTIEDDLLIDGNKAGMVECKHPRHVSGTNPSIPTYWNLIYQEMSEVIHEDIISIKLKVNLADSGCENFVIRLRDGRSTEGGWDNLIKPTSIALGGGESDYYTEPYIYNTWIEIELLLDRVNKQLTTFANGVQLAEPQLTHETLYQEEFGLRGISIGTPRTTNAIGSKFYVDDIVISSYGDGRTVSEAAGKISAFGDVTEDLPLYDRIYGADVTWSSDNTEIIANDGTITRPIGGTAQTVNLTATINRGTQTQTKTVTANVLPTRDYEVLNVTVADGEISDVTIKKNNPSADAAIYVAVYQDEQLISIEILNLGSSETEIIPLGTALPTGSTYKIFIWDKFNMKPLATSREG